MEEMRQMDFLAHPSASAPTPAPAVQNLPLVNLWETDSDDAHHADVLDKDLANALAPASSQAPAGQSHHIHHVIDLWDSEDSENFWTRVKLMYRHQLKHRHHLWHKLPQSSLARFIILSISGILMIRRRTISWEMMMMYQTMIAIF
jgi:hypothetical protein